LDYEQRTYGNGGGRRVGIADTRVGIADTFEVTSPIKRRSSMETMEAIIRAGETAWVRVEKGVELAVLSGDPEQPGGSFVIRYRTSREITVPAHCHPQEEHVTVLDGVLEIGFGEVLDPAALVPCEAGAYVHIPAGCRHFTRYVRGTVVQVHGTGPFQTTYIDCPTAG
jgi:quercetin dioxygenase-like cupin family protein